MKLEEGQAVLELLSSRSILTASPDPCSDRFADLVFFLVQHCGQLDLDTKCRLVNENMMSKDDALENSFNILHMLVRIYGASAA
ncbi:hypothetical protein SAY87_002277 [Trapa incisa]|uniref:Uncharacterized protein n=1 Tax=Trapa incisa TaxID=236973 RepID=A0AAN7PUZ8_9MYRT|nr:hypothetical protein SAY87_002277 [Trapa incisa]